MTKRDYVRLASIIRDAHRAARLGLHDSEQIVTDIEREIGDWLHADSPRFDPDSWAAACNPMSDPREDARKGQTP